jgi:hypothetical protein
MATAQPSAFRLAPSRVAGLRSRVVGRAEAFANRVSRYFVRHGPGLSLWFVSPVVAELVLGSSPPLVALLLGWVDLLMYGGGVVIIRELVRRWGKGWPSIVALGVAYGIAEEGFALRSFFNPAWNGAAGLAGYGWVGGINWFWATEMAAYHSIVSILLPIVLVTIAFRTRANEAWIPGGSLIRVVAGFLISVAVCWAIAPYPVGAGPLLGCLAAMAVCAVVARLLPARLEWPAGGASRGRATGDGASEARVAPAPRIVFRVCLGVTTLAFALVFGRGFGLPWPAAAALLVALILATAAWLLRASAGIGWDDRHRFAFPAGVMAFFVGFSPLIELTGGRGQIVVGLVTALILRRVWLMLANPQRPPVAASAQSNENRSGRTP